MPSYLAKLEQEVQELRALNEHLRDKTVQLNKRIRRLEEYGNALVSHVYCYRTQRQWTGESYLDLIKTIADWDKAKGTKP